ncbi:MAG: hypothetical protein ACQZ2J_01875 [Pseudomonas piscis]|uniref:DUF4177 domain-containing protein n=1 Tax=Pseudomonas sessilinigenes TaxID=658629 RepID=A0ABX8MHS1_9PSED|nr:hypothetical protein [Pseudomonas sessilinigenes]AZC24808.1 Aconitase B [Pseudomonas sessilinigenes]QXH37860.1 hypothetical protein KSS89_16325 [Pseudomonas sessilinigenes]
MSEKRFEHRIEHLPIPFRTQQRGTLMFKTEESTLEPDLPALLQNESFRAELDKLGKAGWELVAVQAVCRGEIKVGNQNMQAWAYGFPMPIGYLLFLKREC